MRVTVDVSLLRHLGRTHPDNYYEYERGVILVVPDEGAHHITQSARETLALSEKLARAYGIASGLIILMDRFMDFDSGARRVFGEEADPTAFCSVALVGGTRLGRAMGAFFVGLRKPKLSTRLFGTFDEALAWTRKMRDERRKLDEPRGVASDGKQRR